METGGIGRAVYQNLNRRDGTTKENPYLIDIEKVCPVYSPVHHWYVLLKVGTNYPHITVLQFAMSLSLWASSISSG